MYKWLFLVCCLALHAQEPDMEKISEAMGHLIGKNLQSIGVGVDLDAVIKGMQDAAAGKQPPLNEEQCVQAIAALQEETVAQKRAQKVAEAEKFLSTNREAPGIVCLEGNKLQYKVDKPGEGAPAEKYNAPLLRFQVHGLDGHLIGSSEGDEVLYLEDTLPGFSQGILGMREGEIRTLYIHPDLGQPEEGLCICKVELLKVDASHERPMPSLEGLEAAR